jgi:hypothetical protein
MRNHRSPNPPLFTVDRPIGHHWTWEVTYQVASSGYPTKCHVTSMRGHGVDIMVGVAWCDMTLGDDLREAIECLAVESMLAACEPPLDGTHSSRRVILSSHL